jgi:hypothetical protein
VTREYIPSVIPRQAGRKDGSLAVGMQVMDATGKLSSERWNPSMDKSDMRWVQL